MKDINLVTLIGRVTKNVEGNEQYCRTTKSGVTWLNIPLAVKGAMKASGEWQEKTNFFYIRFLGKQAEAVKKYLVKGQQIAVQGSLSMNNWEDSAGKHSRVEIVASNIQLLGGAPKKNDNGGNSSKTTSGQNAKLEPAPRDIDEDEPVSIDDENVPF